MVSLAIWQDMRLIYTCKNLVYDLAHHESPIAQWLKRPLTSIWNGRSWVRLLLGAQKFQLESASLLFTLYPSHKSIYQKLVLSSIMYQNNAYAAGQLWKMVRTRSLSETEANIDLKSPVCLRNNIHI